MKKKDLTIPIIADIHLNNENAERIYQELEEYFLPTITEDCDAVIIAGDLVDTKVSFDSVTTKYVLKFLNNIRWRMAPESPLILLKGTKTHDYNIVDTLKDTIDGLFCVSEVDTCEIEGNKILLMPEEYPRDWREHYKDFLNIEGNDDFEKYDLIAFHGMVDFASHPSCIIESERNIHSAVVFPSELLMNSSKICIGGHVHNMEDYKSIHYCKSFSRLNFGEEEDKGFIIWYGGTRYERIVNEFAPTYQTVILEDFYDPEKQNVKEVIDAIDDFKKEDSEGHLRIRIMSNEISDKLHSDILILKEKYADDKAIKIDMSHSFNKKKRKSEIEEKTDEIIHESVINNEPIEKTIKKFSEEKFNVKLQEDEIIDIISKK